jgi:hypothetical protein
MKWFTNKKKRRLEMVQQGLRATSKSSLKLQCLFCAKCDLKEAKELYDFLASDMPDLPDQDPIPPTWQQNTANAVNGIIAWVKENGPTIQQAYQYVQQIIANKGVLPPVTPEEPVEPLPPIN